MENKIITLAKKLQALAERGEGGEKINAQKMLENMIKKHKLSIEDIEGEKKSCYYFKVSSIQYDLFIQVSSTIVGRTVQTYVSKSKRGQLGLIITACQSIELQMKYDFYWSLFLKELEIFKHAFVIRNNIYACDDDGLRSSELSPEEKEKLLRSLQMSSGITKGEMQPMLQK